jgi:hypothetical protein
MTYRRFKFNEEVATAATLATLRHKSFPTVATFASVAGRAALQTLSGVVAEPDEVEIEERRAMAMGGVPEAYLDGWARLQVQRPVAVSEDEWRQAIIDAGLFLDRFGDHAVELGWTPGDLFDAPCDSSPGGLVWRTPPPMLKRTEHQDAASIGKPLAISGFQRGQSKKAQPIPFVTGPTLRA